MHKGSAIFLAVCFSMALAAQVSEPAPQHSMPETSDGTISTMDSLNFRESLHMKMTTPRNMRPDDAERAHRIVETARSSLSQYVDYRRAERDGYRMVVTPVSRTIYHFTNFRNWQDAEKNGAPFDPKRPTSLIYAKRGSGYILIGVMYSAPAAESEDELDKRIPLSFARWHAHINVCLPRTSEMRKIWEPHPRFGEIGTIATPQACAQAGGAFLPQIYGWMVHMYLFEERDKDIWSVTRVAEEEDTATP